MCFVVSPFVMDEFKRKYSNEDTLTVAIPYFWENFDPEGYSIWYSQYKYNDELTLAFMSCNLISGKCLHVHTHISAVYILSFKSWVLRTGLVDMMHRTGFSHHWMNIPGV